MVGLGKACELAGEALPEFGSRSKACGTCYTRKFWMGWGRIKFT